MEDRVIKVDPEDYDSMVRAIVGTGGHTNLGKGRYIVSLTQIELIRKANVKIEVLDVEVS